MADPDILRSYTTPPALDITLEEFETFAIARLKGLCSIDQQYHDAADIGFYQS
jgi:hypothetical protein